MLKFMRSRRAFTLVEILVAVAILALLAAIAVPVVIHLRGEAEADAKTAELSQVQAAVDNMMAVFDLDGLGNEVAVATDDMGQFPDWESVALGGYVLYPGGELGTYVYKNGGGTNDSKYIRQHHTKYSYTCADDGTVSQA